MLHVIIAGCGRVGSQLAVALSQSDHDVVIIDKNPLAFRRLGRRFSGEAMVGVVFDRQTLENARIRQARAFVAVTSGDNSNIVSARTAQEHFGVERVVARIYDPDRAVIYERLGITTIASAQWTSEAILRVLLPVAERVEGSLGPGSGDVALLTLTVPAGVHGLHAERVGIPGKAVLAAFTRGGQTKLPAAGVLLETGDQVHLAVDRGALDQLRLHVAELGEGE